MEIVVERPVVTAGQPLSPRVTVIAATSSEVSLLPIESAAIANAPLPIAPPKPAPPTASIAEAGVATALSPHATSISVLQSTRVTSVRDATGTAAGRTVVVAPAEVPAPFSNESIRMAPISLLGVSSVVVDVEDDAAVTGPMA